MASSNGSIPVRLFAVLGDDELPPGVIEVATVDLPITVTESTEPSESGHLIASVTPDLSVFERLAEFLASESSRDPHAEALDTEADRLAIVKAQEERARVYADPASSFWERFDADRTLNDARKAAFENWARR